MTHVDDDELVARLRERALGAVPEPGLDPAAVLVASRRKHRTALAARTSAAVVGVCVAAFGTVTWLAPSGPPVLPADPAPLTTTASPTDEAPESPSAPPTMCAELPPSTSDGPSLEGWWNATPADDDGDVLTDPADWPQVLRDHPRTVVVDTRTRIVTESFDRFACGPVAGYEVPAGLELPPDSVVVLDAETDEVLAERPLG